MEEPQQSSQQSPPQSPSQSPLQSPPQSPSQSPPQSDEPQQSPQQSPLQSPPQSDEPQQSPQQSPSQSPPQSDEPQQSPQQPSPQSDEPQQLDLEDLYQQELKKMEQERYEMRKKLTQPGSSQLPGDPVNLEACLRLYITRGLRGDSFPESVILSEDYQRHFVEVGKSAIRDLSNQMKDMLKDLEDFQFGILFTLDDKVTLVIYPYNDKLNRMRNPIDHNYIIEHIRKSFGHIENISFIKDSSNIPPLKYEDIYFYNPQGLNHFYRPYIKYIQGQQSIPIVKSLDVNSRK